MFVSIQNLHLHYKLIYWLDWTIHKFYSRWAVVTFQSAVKCQQRQIIVKCSLQRTVVHTIQEDISNVFWTIVVFIFQCQLLYHILVCCLLFVKYKYVLNYIPLLCRRKHFILSSCSCKHRKISFIESVISIR